METSSLESQYRARQGRGWLRRLVEPPAPYVMNSAEPHDFPMGRWNLYIGGAGRAVQGYVNLDLVCVPGVDVAADAEQLPFDDGVFQRVECDAVLEHVRDPLRVMDEIRRVMAPGGYAHFVTPFCHPFHEYPKDYRRFTIEGLCELSSGFDIVASGWRTGPAATMLVFTLEFAKGLLPWRWWRGLAHVGLGWVLFPFRYLDLWLLRTGGAGKLGNHCFLWVRKRELNGKRDGR